MDNYLKLLTVSSLYNEILRILVGLLFLFYLNLVFKPEINLIPNFVVFDNFTKTIILLAFSYAISRFFLLISDLWMYSVLCLFKKNTRDKFNKIWNHIIGIANHNLWPISHTKDMSCEIQEYIDEHEYFKEQRTKISNDIHFYNLTLGALIVSSPIILNISSLTLIIICLAIVMLTIKNFFIKIEVFEMKQLVGERILREVQKKR